MTTPTVGMWSTAPDGTVTYDPGTPVRVTSGYTSGWITDPVQAEGEYIRAVPTLPAFSAESSASMWGSVPGYAEFIAGGSVVGPDQSTWRASILGSSAVIAPAEAVESVAETRVPVDTSWRRHSNAPRTRKSRNGTASATTTTSGTTMGHETTIANLYRELFNKAPDAEGMAFWSSMLASGKSVDYVRQEMRKSGAFIAARDAAAAAPAAPVPAAAQKSNLVLLVAVAAGAYVLLKK